MSKASIQSLIEQVRNETQLHGNTRGRIASLLTQLNSEKLDRPAVEGIISEITNLSPLFFDQFGNILESLTQGWTLQYSDGEYVLDTETKIIRKVTGYTGGTGTLPAALSANIGKYFAKAGGFTAVKADATDFRGAAGADGADGENKIEKWEPKPYTEGQQVITDDGWFGVRDGMGALATDIPSEDSLVWEQVGGNKVEVSPVFNPETETIPQGGKQIADRYDTLLQHFIEGVPIIEDINAAPIIGLLNNNNAISTGFSPGRVIKDFDVSGKDFITYEACPYYTNSPAEAYSAVLGKKSDGSFVVLLDKTIGIATLKNVQVNVKGYVSVSICWIISPALPPYTAVFKTGKNTTNIENDSVYNHIDKGNAIFKKILNTFLNLKIKTPLNISASASTILKNDNTSISEISTKSILNIDVSEYSSFNYKAVRFTTGDQPSINIYACVIGVKQNGSKVVLLKPRFSRLGNIDQIIEDFTIDIREYEQISICWMNYNFSETIIPEFKLIKENEFGIENVTEDAVLEYIKSNKSFFNLNMPFSSAIDLTDSGSVTPTTLNGPTTFTIFKNNENTLVTYKLTGGTVSFGLGIKLVKGSDFYDPAKQNILAFWKEYDLVRCSIENLD